MSLLSEWTEKAYNENATKEELNALWNGEYFPKEKEIYSQILKKPDEVVKGTVKELAEKFDTSIFLMTGFLDGINESLKEKNPSIPSDSLKLPKRMNRPLSFCMEFRALENQKNPGAIWRTSVPRSGIFLQFAEQDRRFLPLVNVNLILYKKWKIILYNFQLFSGWLSRNARLSFSL